MARTPHPRPLEYITPSQLIEGDSCLWRLGFSSDPLTAGLNRSGPAAALGTAAHEVMSRMGEAISFETVWSQAVSRAADDLRVQWAPANPPSPENWPGWSLTKVRMKKLWERNPASTTGTGPRTRDLTKSSGRTEPPLPWRERWLRHKTLPLAGRPDLVERIGGAVYVVDLKTGLDQAEPTLPQRTQLLLYSELVSSTLGETPGFVAVESTRGQRFAFAVDDDEVQGVVGDAVTMLNRLSSPREEGLHESLANPSPEACGWCSFRPICSPFFDNYDETWPIAHALLFRVRSATESQHGWEVEATVLKPLWRHDEEVHVVGFPFESTPQVGEVWGAANFVGRANSALAAWNTSLARWQDSDANSRP
jgi:hypothetical protein